MQDLVGFYNIIVNVIQLLDRAMEGYPSVYGTLVPSFSRMSNLPPAFPLTHRDTSHFSLSHFSTYYAVPL